jgi:hypothetical protein
MENAGTRSMMGADKIEENSVKKYLERQHYLLLEDFCRPLRTAIGITERKISPIVFVHFLFNLSERDFYGKINLAQNFRQLRYMHFCFKRAVKEILHFTRWIVQKCRVQTLQTHQNWLCGNFGKIYTLNADILNDSSNGIAILLTKFRGGIAPGDLDGGSVLRYLGRATVKARCYERSAHGYLLQLEEPGTNQEIDNCFGNMT